MAKYKLYAGDAFIKAHNGSTATPKEIMAFVKDTYGMPYVPGSSIKGMIRTALLAWEIHKKPPKYEEAKQSIVQNASRGNRGNLLSRETDSLEEMTFHTVKREEIARKNAVCSNMSGLIVSDSEPISLEQLTLSQKIDYNLQGRERAIPILRETLMPGTNVYFTITIDTDICPYTIEDILDALNYFQEVSYERFYKRFRRGKKEDGIVWFGGGTGFLSKTIMYSMFEDEAYRVVDETFKVTVAKKYYEHNHNKNVPFYKLAPHVCKCTRYQGELYDMGMGRIELLSVEKSVDEHQ